MEETALVQIVNFSEMKLSIIVLSCYLVIAVERQVLSRRNGYVHIFQCVFLFSVTPTLYLAVLPPLPGPPL